MTDCTYQIRYDDAPRGTYDSFDEAATVALREAPDGAQMQIEELRDRTPVRVWTFDRDESGWIVHSRPAELS